MDLDQLILVTISVLLFENLEKWPESFLHFSQDIKKLKYNFEVQNKVIFILGITSDEAELERVFDHARSIKGVQDIISYVDIISTDNSDSWKVYFY